MNSILRFLIRQQPDEPVNYFKEIFGWIGAALSIFFFIGPLTLVIETFKGKRNYKDMNPYMLFINMSNCVLWVAYGLRLGELQMYVTNGTGTAFSLVWISFYLYFLAEKKPLLTVFYLILFYDIYLEVFYIFFKLVGEKAITGYIVLVINVVMYAAPGYKIFLALKNSDHTLLPIHISFIALASSACWFIYGLYISNPSTYVPNGMGVVFSVAQVVVYFIAKSRGKNLKKEAPKENAVPTTEMGVAKKEDVQEDRKQTADTENALGLLVKVDKMKKMEGQELKKPVPVVV